MSLRTISLDLLAKILVPMCHSFRLVLREFPSIRIVSLRSKLPLCALLNWEAHLTQLSLKNILYHVLAKPLRHGLPEH